MTATKSAVSPQTMRLYNEDCVSGAKAHLATGSVDLIISDPPFGIDEKEFERLYNRKEYNVFPGYVEAPDNYLEWTKESCMTPPASPL